MSDHILRNQVNVYIYMYVCMYVCMYACMYVCMYVCTYAYRFYQGILMIKHDNIHSKTCHFAEAESPLVASRNTKRWERMMALTHLKRQAGEMSHVTMGTL